MAKNIKKINFKKFFLNIILPSIFSILLFIILIFGYIIPYFEKSLLQSKKEMIRELVNSAISIADKNHKDFISGKKSLDSAKQDAIEKISHLRYGQEGQDYFFITDFKPNMIMHPYRLDLNGTDLTYHKDPKGKRLFVEMVDQVKKGGEGFVDYQWQWMNDEDRIVPKISYVKEFKPWAWIIGTGIYVEDVNEKIASIEKEMIIVSIAISGIISILLIIIVYQNFNTELKRGQAEIDLMISRQKYKALVEASTEGTAMTLDNDLVFKNKLFESFFKNGLNDNLNITEIIGKAEDVSKVNAFIESSINYIQFETELNEKVCLKKNGLISLSKISLSDKNGLIIVIKELEEGDSIIRKQLHNNSMQLLELMNTGIFSLSVSDKFIEVNDSAAKILKYPAIKELLKKGLYDLAIDKGEAALALSKVKSEGKIINFKLEIYNFLGEKAFVSIDAFLVKSPEDEMDYISGFITDITEEERKNKERLITNSELMAAWRHLDQELKYFQKETISCDMNLEAKNAVLLMKRNDTDALLIRSNNGVPVGIVTGSDIRSRFIGSDMNLLVHEIMSSPIYSMPDSALLSEAFIKMREKGIHHVLVKDSANNLTGIVGLSDIIKNQQSAIFLMLNAIRNADSLNNLKNIYSRTPYFIHIGLEGGAKSEYLLKCLSLIAGAIKEKISEIIYLEIGKPPSDFSLISLGSEGRDELTLLSDQDNALIFPDESISNKAYFLRFAERMNYMLDAIGYPYCKGGIMAKNPKWNCSISAWKEYFQDWITNPEPQNLLELSIFFDLKLSIGSEDLIIELKKHINKLLQNNKQFLNFLSRDALTYKTQLSIFGKLQTETIDEHSKSINIKHALRVITHLVRLYAMKSGIKDTNTLTRLRQLRNINVFSEQFCREIEFCYDFMIKLQLKSQYSSIEQNHKAADYVHINDLSQIELNLLKSIFNQISLFQSKLRYEFNITE